MFKETLDDFEQWLMTQDMVGVASYVTDFREFVNDQHNPQKGDVWRVRCITSQGPEGFTFYMWYDGEHFIDGAIWYDLDELILEERIGTDPAYKDLSRKKANGND